MSLDVYLQLPAVVNGDKEKVTPVAIHRNGQNIRITREEWDSLYPGINPYTIKEEVDPYVYDANITHNLGAMANAAGIYKAMWHPEDINAVMAADIIGILGEGLRKLKENPDEFKKYNPPNGWGDYDALCRFVDAYLKACIEYPNAYIYVSR